jgi:hypothetical protein
MKQTLLVCTLKVFKHRFLDSSISIVYLKKKNQTFDHLKILIPHHNITLKTLAIYKLYIGKKYFI